MSNKEKYEGKTVEVYSPFGRKLETALLVIEVIDEHCIYGKSKTRGFETAYDLNDGVTVKVVE